MKVITHESHEDGSHQIIVYTEGYPPWDRVENYDDLIATYELPNADLEVYNGGFTYVWIKRDQDCDSGGCGDAGSGAPGDAVVDG